MLVSVALPVYNGQPYLELAIASILAQDIELELLISDDGSDDGTVELLKRITDDRVTIVLNTENGGIFGNLNRCIALARGAFIQVFSQDDIMHAGYLRSQVEILEKYPQAGLAYGMPDYIDAAGVILSTQDDAGTPELIDHETYLWIASHYGSLPASISSVMIRRDAFDAIGLFDAKFRVAGDLEFYNRISERFRIVFDRRKLHSVRSHARAASQHATTGQAYLREEIVLDAWFRRRWSRHDYRRIRRFRSALRGRYHLGWIRRLLQRRQFGSAARALAQMNVIYPLPWVLTAQVLRLLRPSATPRPTVRPPNR